MATWIALTDMLLPYDESFLGIDRATIEGFNPRILQFVTHDRVPASVTRVAVSILYIALSPLGTRGRSLNAPQVDNDARWRRAQWG